MVRTGLAYHDRFLEHQTGPNHPERPERLLSILRGLHDRKSVAETRTHFV